MKIKVPAITWIGAVFIVAVFFGVLLFLIDQKIGILAFAIILDIGLGLPYYNYNKHIDEIERQWPDALRLIADTMKSGSSFEFAIREASSADLGQLSYEFNETIRRLEMGDTMSTALSSMYNRIDSKIVRRTLTIIQECIRTGAQLADVLDDIANGTKSMYKIKKERITKTMLQVVFIFIASAIIAPFIFGLTNVITTFLVDVAKNSGIATGSALEISVATQSAIKFLLDCYILIEVAAASVIVGMMREGRISKSIIMFPIMVVVAFIVYSVSQAVITMMLTGVVGV